MLIRRLTLTDFGQFRGETSLALSVDWSSDRNIVLIGGLNGSGKTTLMRAIRLALFGKLNVDLWGKTSYKSFIRRYLNRASAKEGVRGFSLEVELEVGDAHGLSTLSVRRRWKMSHDFELTGENLQIYGNGEEKLGLSQEEAELFILERIPYTTSRFVFFDGDRVQDIARAELLGPRVRSAIESVLGMSLYLELHKDLLSHERHFIRTHSDDIELNTVMQHVDRADRELDDVRSARRNCQSDIERLEATIHALQEERKRLGGGQLLDRTDIDDALEGMKEKRDGLRRRLSQIVSTDLPMIIVRPNLLRLREALQREAAIEQEVLVARLLDNKRAVFLDAFKGVAATKDTATLAAVSSAWSTAFSGPVEDVSTPRHRHLSLDQKQSICAQVTESETTAMQNVSDLLKDLAQIEYKIRRVQWRLRSMPEDTAYAELEERERQSLAELRDLSQRLGMLSVEERRLEHELATARRSEELTKRKVTLQRELQHKLGRERRLIEALEEFIDRLAQAKIGQVERYLTRMFTQLSRKDDMAEEFAIDPETYTPALIKADGQRFELEALSEGEKEIFALSFLWAIGRSGAQELPMVIDTPLARLDSVHRRHIAERFLPDANRQTIIFSTDTEVDEDLWRYLRPCVARAYRLEYDPKASSTRVFDGYLFEEAT